MKTLNDLIAKLELTFSNATCDGETLRSGNWEFDLDTRLATNIHDMDTMPIQAIANVKYKGLSVLRWGAENSKDNTKLVSWYTSKKRDGFERKYKSENRDRETGGQLFWNQ